MDIAPDDLPKLRAVKNGGWSMRRGVTAEWLGRMLDLGFIRRRRPCESNGWMDDYLLTRAGELTLVAHADVKPRKPTRFEYTARESCVVHGRCTGPVESVPVPGSVDAGLRAACPKCGKRVRVTVGGRFAHHKAA